MKSEYERELGKLVINAGLLENSLRGTLLKLSKDQGKLARIFILPNYSTSQKLELLKRLTHSVVDKNNLSDWDEFIDETRELFTMRNALFHGMSGMNGDKFIICSVKKGKNGKSDSWEEKPFGLDALKDLNKKVSNRHRQLMDFIEEIAGKYDGEFHDYPELKI